MQLIPRFAFLFLFLFHILALCENVTMSLDSFFKISERGSTVGREVRGGLATFLTMSYILIANPAILHLAGVPLAPAVASTAIAAGLSCVLMGVWANFPLALASGMGLNAVVAFQVTKVTGSWQTAMGLIVLDGVVILALVLMGVREAMMDAIPRDLRRAIGAGIGLFIAFIGAVNGRLVQVPAGTLFELGKNPAGIMPPVGPGSLAHPEAAVAIVGLALTAFLMARRVRGAILIGIGFGTALGLALGISKLPTVFGLPDLSLIGQADIRGALKPAFAPLLLAILLVDFFDTLGTVTAVAEAAHLSDPQTGAVPGLREVLIVDSIAASIGGFCGASSVTSYIESAAGVAEGARTGLHTVITGVLFLASAFLAPLAAMIPAAATAPALILVGALMIGALTDIDWADPAVAIPAFLTVITIPLSYSIANGLAFGITSYALLLLVRGKARPKDWLLFVLAALFILRFVYLAKS